MNEATINELLSRLFAMSYKRQSEYIRDWECFVIEKEHREAVENVIRQWALEFHENRIGTLEAKVFTYEQIIKNSNFAPIVQNGNDGQARVVGELTMQLKPVGKKVRLLDLDPGMLFAFDNDCIAVKSEYCLESGKIQAIIVGSGEFFHGGAKTVEEQYNLMVQPLELED